ncbi:hypothetical protein NDU88_006535 [Pleurodeles waltl]|uniref:Uncharacterized protein n=1 Tax=Pleurodeles waltl TaxID=8319 RepID=A0AAV7VN10_PLEWA|nr:hypothetical protein NDU88_006535 [Pleurodeles waltl]
MDPRSHERPQEDDNRPETSQEDRHKTQEREKKKRKCRFSAQEHEILVKECGRSTECKKRWHDCKCRTKEKMARNRKAALQTGGGSPAPQEALDLMEEMVAAIIPEEIVTGIQGQDSADYQDTTQLQEDDGSPGDMPVLDFPDDMDDELTNISQQTL